MSGTTTALRRRAIESIYDAVLDPRRLPEAVDRIAAATGAMGGMLGIFDMVNGQGHAPATAGLDPCLLELFEKRYGLNLWTDAMRAHGGLGQAVSSEPFVEARALRRTEFYDAILAPQSIVAQSFVLLRRDGRFTIGLPMMHTDPGHSAKPDVLRCHRELAKHMGNAVEMMRRLDTLRSQLETTEAALEHYRCAVFVLNGAAMIRYSNARARRLLAEGDGLVSLGCRLTARHQDDGTVLAYRIATAANLSHGGRQATAIPIRRGIARLPLLAMVFPGSEQRCILDLPGSPNDVLLFVADPSERGSAAADLLRDAFALTDREISVALATARLGGVPAVAAELGISPTTVRTHLQHVFDKTGLRSQMALISLLGSCGVLPQPDT